MRTLLVALAAAALAAAGDPGTPEYAKAAGLVKQLGHARFPVREAAAKALVEMGGPAAAALREGRTSADEEVRGRSANLLPKAIALDWQRRADAYLADPDGKPARDLPLLPAYAKLVGKPDAGLRKLFAGMLRTNGPLLAAAAADATAVPKAVAARTRVLLDTYHVGHTHVKADPAEVAALLFVQSVAAPSRNPGGVAPASPAVLLGNPGVGEAIADPDLGPAFRKLVTRWAETLPADDTVGRRSFCLAARKYALPEAVPELAKYAKDAKADALSVRVLAVEALGKAGGPDATAALESLLGDTTDVVNFGGGGDTYVLGDSALAALITLNKKKLAEYGLRNQIGIGFDYGDGGEPVNLMLYGFSGREERTKNVRKWRAEAAKKK